MYAPSSTIGANKTQLSAVPTSYRLEAIGSRLRLLRGLILPLERGFAVGVRVYSGAMFACWLRTLLWVRNLRVASEVNLDIILTEKAPVDPRFDTRFSLYIRAKDTGDSWYTSIHNW